MGEDKEVSPCSTGFLVSTVGIDEGIIKRYVEMQGKEDTGQEELEL